MPKPRQSDTPQGTGNQPVALGDTAELTTRIAPNGGRLKTGNPGNKGGAGGHNSLARQIRMGYLADTFLNKATAVVTQPDHPKFADVGKWVTEMVEGKPNQSLQVDASVQIVVSQGLGVRDADG